MTIAWPSPFNLAYGASLAIISFVGLESISQASQETIRPGRVVPRTSIALILTVLIFALAFSNLGLAMLPWQSIVAHQGDPVAWLASHIPNRALVSLLIIPLGVIILVRACMIGLSAWTLIVLGVAFVALGIVRLRVYIQYKRAQGVTPEKGQRV